MTYKVRSSGFIHRLADNADIPPDPANRDYAAYLAWVAAGNTAPPDVQPATAGDVEAVKVSRLAAGFADPVTGKTFQCDTESRGYLAAIGSSAGFAKGQAKNFPIIAADNSVVTLNPADTFSLLNDRLFPWVSATVFYAKGLKDAIRAGTPPADITTGWP